MSRESTTDTLQSINPNNDSGPIPSALKLIQNLKKNAFRNPTAMEAVGSTEAAQMAQASAQNNTKKSPYQDLLDYLKQLLAVLAQLQTALAALQAESPQTPEIKAQEAAIQDQIIQVQAQIADVKKQLGIG